MFNNVKIDNKTNCMSLILLFSWNISSMCKYFINLLDTKVTFIIYHKHIMFANLMHITNNNNLLVGSQFENSIIPLSAVLYQIQIDLENLNIILKCRYVPCM